MKNIIGEEDSLDYSQLDEGIRGCVHLLRSNGFRTIHSGDGMTSVIKGEKQNPFDDKNFLPFPHIMIAVISPDDLISEAKRLRGLFDSLGIPVVSAEENSSSDLEMNDDITFQEFEKVRRETYLTEIHASYNVVENAALIIVLHFHDKMLSNKSITQTIN